MAFRAATGLPVMQAKKFIESNPDDIIDRILNASYLVRCNLPYVEALAKVTPELLDRIFYAAEIRQEMSHLNDPIEKDPNLGPIIHRVLDDTTELVKRELEGERLFGSCHRIWRLAKERLWREHGIKWYSPGEMNPGSCFD